MEVLTRSLAPNDGYLRAHPLPAKLVASDSPTTKTVCRSFSSFRFRAMLPPTDLALRKGGRRGSALAAIAIIVVLEEMTWARPVKRRETAKNCSVIEVLNLVLNPIPTVYDVQ